MRAGIVVSVTPQDRIRLEAIIADRNTRQQHAARARVDWFNNRSLLKLIGNIPPAEAEAEARYHASQQEVALAAGLKLPR